MLDWIVGLSYQKFMSEISKGCVSCFRMQTQPQQQMSSAECRQIPVTVQMMPSHVPSAYWSAVSAATAEEAAKAGKQPPITCPIQSSSMVPAPVDPTHSTAGHGGGTVQMQCSGTLQPMMTGAWPKAQGSQHIIQGPQMQSSQVVTSQAAPKSFLLKAKKILLHPPVKQKKQKGDLPDSCPQLLRTKKDTSDTGNENSMIILKAIISEHMYKVQ